MYHRRTVSDATRISDAQVVVRRVSEQELPYEVEIAWSLESAL